MNWQSVVRDTPLGAVIAIRVTPRASRSKVQGILEREPEPMLKIALNAPPVDGRANEELLAFLSLKLDLPRSSLEIVRGLQSREKLVRTLGIAASEVAPRLHQMLSTLS